MRTSPRFDASRYATLIETAELARHLGDPAFVIVDVRHDLSKPERFGVDAYAQGHVPGAVLISIVVATVVAVLVNAVFHVEGWGLVTPSLPSSVVSSPDFAILVSSVLTVPVAIPVTLAISDAVIGPSLSASRTLALF